MDDDDEDSKGGDKAKTKVELTIHLSNNGPQAQQVVFKCSIESEAETLSILFLPMTTHT